MAEPLLILQDLCKSYGAAVPVQVLFDLCATIDKGEFSAIIGRSGSGKSTLLNILGALDRPTGGSIIADGENLADLSNDALAAYRNRSLGFIFQFHHLLPEFSALENVLIPARIAGKKINGALERRAKDLLERVGVADRMKNRATALSGGQQQRVAIARSLINAPSLILADEPTGNLDSEMSEQIFALMREIHKNDGTTFLIVTHDRHIAARCDRVIELVDGRIARDVKTNGEGFDARWNEFAPCFCKLNGLDPLR